MRSTVLSILLTIMGASVAIAASTDVPIQKGWHFAQARAALIHNGWAPVRSADPLSKFDQENPLGQEYPEIEVCSQGLMFCWFHYSKDGRCLRVETRGEIKMGVIYWDDKCPGQH